MKFHVFLNFQWFFAKLFEEDKKTAAENHQDLVQRDSEGLAVPALAKAAPDYPQRH